MTITITDVLTVNIVLLGVPLLTTPTEIKAFQRAIEADVTQASGINIDAAARLQEQTRLLTVNRDRINVDTSTTRSIIVQEYPPGQDFTRVAEVAAQAIQQSQPVEAPTAFGCNLELAYDQDSGLPASSYLANRLFANHMRAIGEWDLLHGMGQMTFGGPDALWKITLESRFQDEATTKIFLKLNMHKAEQRIPDQEEIRVSLEKLLERALTFINEIDAVTP